MTQTSNSILFVTTDGKGVKSSVIRAHAARRGHQKSRQNITKQSPESDRKKHHSASPEAAIKPKVRRKLSVKPTEDDNNAKATKILTSSHRDDEAALLERQLVTTSTQEKPSPFQIWLPSCMSDRFVQMFFETMMPSYTAAYDVFHVPNIIKQEWPLYMNHEVFLWTEAAAIQGLYESLQDPSKPPSQKVLLYQAKALSCLKKELVKNKDGKLDDYMVMSIFVLAALSLMAGDEIAHNAHKRILRTAFATAGGLHNYGSFVRNTTMRLDSFWRSTANEPKEPAVPLLQPSRVPTIPHHPFSREICDIIDCIPVGFQDLAIQCKLPFDILEVLGRIANPMQKPLPHVLTTGSKQDNRSPSTHCGMYLDFWEACPSLSSTRRDSNGEPTLERLLSLALLIYATNRDATNPLRMYNCITNGAIYDLCYDLPLCVAQRPREEEHCLFWIWSVTVDAMRDRFAVLTAQGEQLFEQQKKRFPGVVGTGIEERVLERFWFASEYSDGSCLFTSSSVVTRSGSPRPRGGLRRASTYATTTSRQSESVGSPDTTGSLSFSRTDSMDSWSVATPQYEKSNADYEINKSATSQADDTESVVSKRNGPGFGVLPRNIQLDDIPELGYGKVGRRPGEAPVRCVAG